MAMNAAELAADIKSRRDAVLDAYVNRSDYTSAEADAFRLALAMADAEAIINHIINNAEIASLTVNNTTYAGSGAHTHTPASTSSAVGKIS
jgi:hypothetical protein